jgi:CheY-like chemotaxis protein
MKNEKPLSGYNALVAEDNPLSMSVVRQLFRKWVVGLTTNGLEVIRHFQPGKFDILLIDLEMPEMDGLTAVETIRQTDKTVPVIAYTASSNKIHTELLQKGFTDFLQKPFMAEELYAKISTWVTTRHT